MNLFDLLDGTFRGTVYFVYSVLTSILQLVLHPYRGPGRLHRDYLASEKDQVSSITLLVLSLIMVGLLVSPDDLALTGHVFKLQKLLADMVSTGEVKSIAPVAVGAIVGAGVIDAALRALARIRYGGRHDHRRRLVAITEYSFSLLFVLLCVIDKTIPLAKLSRYDGGMMPPPMIAAFAVGLFYFYAALYHFWRGCGFGAPTRWRREWRQFRRGPMPTWFGPDPRPVRGLVMTLVRLWLALLLVECLAFPPVLLCEIAALAAIELPQLVIGLERPGAELRVIESSCVIEGDRLAVRAMLWNGSDTPALHVPDRLRLVLRGDAEIVPTPPLRWRLDGADPGGTVMRHQLAAVAGDARLAPKALAALRDGGISPTCAFDGADHELEFQSEPKPISVGPAMPHP